MTDNKRDFITAYCCCYGSTKKKAAQVYKETEKAYHIAIIEALKADGRKAFYQD